MGFADLHIHSVHSHDGTCAISAILKRVADTTDLDVIAITDHDQVSGIREAVALGPRYGIDVIPGCEITTAQGHLLALFISHAIPAGLPLVETIRRVGRMGGLCVIPHPEAPAIHGVHTGDIRAALADPEAARSLVGLETFNGGLFFPGTNRVAEALARSLGLAELGSSDSHILETIGQGMTGFEGRTAADFRRALEAHATVALPAEGLDGVTVLRRWFPKYFLRKMGWVAWNSGPEQPLQYVRTAQALAEVRID